MIKLTIEALAMAAMDYLCKMQHARRKLTVINLIICNKLIISASSMMQVNLTSQLKLGVMAEFKWG